MNADRWLHSKKRREDQHQTNGRLSLGNSEEGMGECNSQQIRVEKEMKRQNNPLLLY